MVPLAFADGFVPLEQFSMVLVQYPLLVCLETKRHFLTHKNK